MKPSKEKIKKQKIYGFDIETFGEKNEFLMGSIVNQKEKYVFWDKKEMQKFIFGNHNIRNSLIFATNLGFDFMALFGDDFDLLSQFQIIMRGSDFIIVKFVKSKQQIKFLDTFSFYKGSVEKLGKIIGLEKLEKPSFIGQKVNRFSKDGQYLEEYNIRDSLVSCMFAEFLQESFNKLGCNIKYTIASTSSHLFRNVYLKDFIQQPVKPIIEELYKAYYGGRVEAFKRGKIENLKYYDINSLYPFVMSKYEYPNPNSINMTDETSLNLIKKYEGVSFCRIEIQNFTDDFIPLLPNRSLENNKLLFPVGVFFGHHSHIELRKALRLGYKIEPLFSIYYEKTFNPFKEFIKDLYKKRLKYKEEKSSMELVTKICMNSLYGKFAQKLEQSRILFPDNLQHEKELKNYFMYNAENQKIGKPIRFEITVGENRIIEENGVSYDCARIYYVKDTQNKTYPKFINPILSIYITAYARLELYKYIEDIQKTGHKIYYCDTDSLITDKIMPTSKDIGKLKLEFNIKRGIIVKPKFYYIEDEKIGDVVKAKGLHNLKDFMSFDEVLKNKRYSYMKFTKFKESMKRGFAFNQKIDILKIIDIEDSKRMWFGKKFNKNELQDSRALMIYQMFNEEK